MITTSKERLLVLRLINNLDREIIESGDCEHAVNHCICELKELRRAADYLLIHNSLATMKGI